MNEQVADFRAEADELAGLLVTLSDDDWRMPTQFKDWTINDVVLHLHTSDLMAIASTDGDQAFQALLGEIRARRRQGASLIEEARERLPGVTGAAMLERWRQGVDTLCERLDRLDPDTRLPWVAMPMGLRMFTTARQMETWAHGLSIYDVLGLERVDTDRIKSIAVIGVRTFGFTFANRKLPVPADVPYVRLTAPSGAIWEWNAPNPDADGKDRPPASSVIGSAVDFCHVVTQVRHHADTGLRIEGDTARQWMSMAQCFAGPPQDPPAGSRYRVVKT
ncbi:MAG: TIGR03084 family metal-binding protein [Burkholderiaceae bacterium]